jgi:hypothetical protein
MPNDASAPAAPRRDPWIVPGAVSLAVLTVLSVLLYTSAPQSAAEVTRSTWVAVSPDAFTPRMARARERVSAALRAAAAGDTAGAVARYAEAEEEAWTARERTADSAQARQATELWAAATLDRAELMLAAGATPWYRGDDDQLLRDALATVERVRRAPVAAPLRRRADALAQRIERQLRPGPLEWLPK